MNNINIVFNIDRNFVQHCVASMNSVLMSYRGKHHIVFYIVHKDLCSDDIKKIKTLESGICTIEFLKIDGSLLKDLPIGGNTVSNEITLSTYFRLFLPILLPLSVDKLIYLDADTVTLESIDELWKTDVSDFALAAVPDKETYQMQNKKRLGISSSYKYINSGVLLMNIGYLRKINFVNLALNYVRKNKDNIVYHDQDVVNALLYKKIFYLSYKWDMMDCYLYKEPICDKRYVEDVSVYQKNPGIIHFAGYIKPWHKECINPYKDYYLKALEGTPWQNFCKTRRLKKTVEFLKFYLKLLIKGTPYFK